MTHILEVRFPSCVCAGEDVVRSLEELSEAETKVLACDLLMLAFEDE